MDFYTDILLKIRTINDYLVIFYAIVASAQKSGVFCQ
jgi:hypothetical protein